MNNTALMFSTSVPPICAYVESPRVKLLENFLGSHLEGITKHDKWVLITVIAFSAQASTCYRFKARYSGYSFGDFFEELNLFIEEDYEPIDLIEVVEEMSPEERGYLAEFLVSDVIHTEVLSPIDPRVEELGRYELR